MTTSKSETGIRFKDSDKLEQNGFFDPDAEVKKKPTSFTPETEEVAVARKHLQEGRPTIAYEWVQNILDYNDWVQGPPELQLILVDGQKIDLLTLLQMESEQFQQIAQQAAQLVVRNNIRDGDYLSPGNLTQIHHGGSESTLGKYGRGGKAGTAAVLAENAAEAIRYVSRDAKGNWKAECYFAKNEDEGQVAPEFSVAFQYAPAETGDPRRQTELIIESPSVDLLTTFRKIPHFFLPANPNYQFFRFSREVQKGYTPNLFTIHALPFLTEQSNSARFTEEELREYLGIKKTDTEYTEPPRVEILADGIINNRGNQGYKDDSVCVDGLRLDTTGYDEDYALRWSFWGTRNARSGYRAARSNDSQRVEGDYKHLMAMVLGKCDNHTVFLKIFEASCNGRSCKETSLPEKQFLDGLEKNPKALDAFKAAWQQFLASRNLPGNAAVAINELTIKKLAKEKPDQPVVLLDSSARLLKNALLKFKLAEDADVMYTVEPEAKETGEVQKFPNEPRRPEVVTDRIFEAMIELDGRNELTPNQEIVFRLENDRKVLYQTFDMLPERVKEVVRKAVGAYGNRVEVTVETSNGTTQSVLIFQPRTRSYWDSDSLENGFQTVKVSTLSKELEGEPGLVIRIRQPQDKDEVEQVPANPELVALVQLYEQQLQEIKNENNRIDIEKFIELFRNFQHTASAIALLEQERKLLELKQIERDMQRRLGLVEEDADNYSPTRSNLDVPPRMDYKTKKPIDRKYVSLFQPNGSMKARASGMYGDRESSDDEGTDQRPAIEMLEDLQRKVENLKRPDIGLLHPELLPAHVRGCLFATYNRSFSGEIEEKQLKVPFTQQPESSGVKINKALPPGTVALPAPLECELVGIYHPDEQVLSAITVSGSTDRFVYSLNSKGDIPPGLEIYYRHIGKRKREAKPTTTERRVLLKTESIKGLEGWKDILEAIDTTRPSLTDKQKLDIISTAWAYTFTYDDNLEVNELYAGLEGQQYYTQLIKLARGNCGHAAEGLVVLCRMLGLPATSYSAYLGKNGRFFPGPQNHAETDVFLNNEWVIVEPQNGLYYSEHFNQDQLPANFKELIKKLPEGVSRPSGVSYQDPLENLGLRQLLREIMTSGESGEKMFELLEETQRLLHEDEDLFREHIDGAGLPEVRRRQVALDVESQLGEVLRVGLLPDNDDSQVRPVLEQMIRQIDEVPPGEVHANAPKKKAVKIVLQAVLGVAEEDDEDEAWRGISDGTRQELKRALLQAVDEQSREETSTRQKVMVDQPIYNRLQQALIAAMDAMGGEAGLREAEEAGENLVKQLFSSLEDQSLRELHNDIKTHGIETTSQRFQRLMAQAVNEVQRYQQETIYPESRRIKWQEVKRGLVRSAAAMLVVGLLGYFILTAPQVLSSNFEANQPPQLDTQGNVVESIDEANTEVQDGNSSEDIVVDGDFVLVSGADQMRSAVTEALIAPTDEDIKAKLDPKTIILLCSNLLSGVAGFAGGLLYFNFNYSRRRKQEESV